VLYKPREPVKMWTSLSVTNSKKIDVATVDFRMAARLILNKGSDTTIGHIYVCFDTTETTRQVAQEFKLLLNLDIKDKWNATKIVESKKGKKTSTQFFSIKLNSSPEFVFVSKIISEFTSGIDYNNSGKTTLFVGEKWKINQGIPVEQIPLKIVQKAPQVVGCCGRWMKIIWYSFMIAGVVLSILNYFFRRNIRDRTS